MAKNIQSLQLLRNTSEFYATRGDALTKLTNITPPVGTQDGSPVLARYRGTDGKIYTLVGYYADASKISGTTPTDITNMTVFDFEGNAADIKELKDMIGSGVTTANTVTKQLQDLSGDTSSDSGDTSVEGAKRYADEKVRAAIDALDYNLAKDDNKVVVSFEQKDGKISGTSENITSVKLDGYEEASTTGDVATTDTLGQALGKLQKTIHEMDKQASSASGEVVITVTEDDGKVDEVKSKIKDILLTGYVKGNGVKPIAETDTINGALSKLENSIDAAQSATTVASADKSITVVTATSGTDISVNIKSGEEVIKKDGGNGIYTDIKLSAVAVSEANVKEAWGLFTGTQQLGNTIKIYKDSSLLSVALLHAEGDNKPTYNKETGQWTDIQGATDANQALCFAYENVNGVVIVEAVPVASFINEQEFASGLTWDAANSKVRGVVDSNSEKNSGNTASFLTVGEGGFKVDGIKQEIINRINELDATLENGTTAGTPSTGHVKVSITETDGKLTDVTVTETNIADADDLAALSAKTVTEIASSNGSIIATKSKATDGTSKYDIITDASKIKMSGFTSTDALSGINATSSVTEAFEEVDKVITSNELIVSTALNDLEATKVDVITVNGKQSKEPASGDVVASVTINGADIKLDGYEIGSSSAAVVSTDTVNQAIGKLENQVKAAVDGSLQEVESGDGISVSAVADNKQTISVKLKETEGGWENPLKFDSNGGLYFNSLDCGTY